MPYLLGFHAIHFWNPWRILINPGYVLFLGPEILSKTALAYCLYLGLYSKIYGSKDMIFTSISSWEHDPCQKCTIRVLLLWGVSLSSLLRTKSKKMNVACMLQGLKIWGGGIGAHTPQYVEQSVAVPLLTYSAILMVQVNVCIPLPFQDFTSSFNTPWSYCWICTKSKVMRSK